MSPRRHPVAVYFSKQIRKKLEAVGIFFFDFFGILTLAKPVSIRFPQTQPPYYRAGKIT